MVSIPLYINSQIGKVDSDWKPDTAVIFWAKFWSVALQIPWDLFLAILYNEGASISRPLRDSERAALMLTNGENVGYPVGDMDIARGPSVGPGQVLRSNVERLYNDLPASTRFLFAADNPHDLALKGHERQALWVCAKVIQEVLKQANGDKQEAARRYNGTNAAAIAYGQKAADTIERLA